MKKLKSTSRLFEKIFGIVASLISLVNGSFFIFLESGGHAGNSFIALVSIVGAILGFVSSFYIDRDLEFAGVGFIIAAILILMSVPHWGIVSSVIFLIVGISALFRK